LSFATTAVLSEALGVELRRPPSDSSFRYFFQQVDVPALCGAIRDPAAVRSAIDRRHPLRSNLGNCLW
jgi:hypothetical protein